MAKGKHISIRRCAACGQRLPKKELIRIVRTLSQDVEVDHTGKKPGRGAYLCSRKECWVVGLKKGHLDHVLHTLLRQQDKETLSAYYQEQLNPISIGDVR